MELVLSLFHFWPHLHILGPHCHLSHFLSFRASFSYSANFHFLSASCPFCLIFGVVFRFIWCLSTAPIFNIFWRPFSLDCPFSLIFFYVFFNLFGVFFEALISIFISASIFTFFPEPIYAFLRCLIFLFIFAPNLSPGPCFPEISPRGFPRNFIF